jgi:hypothetical protein
MKSSAMAVLNEFVKIHNSKRIGKLTVPIVMKYIHLCDIVHYEKYNERMIEDLTLYSEYGPFFEIILRELNCFGFKKEINFEIPLLRYDINGDANGHYIPSVKENKKLEIINIVYNQYSQIDYNYLLEIVTGDNMPSGIAKRKNAIYINEEIFKNFNNYINSLKAGEQNETLL